MFIKGRRKLIWLLAISFFVTQVLIASPLLALSKDTNSLTGTSLTEVTSTANLNTGTDRISGQDRYKTAVAVSQRGWKSADYAVLARGDQFADALCAGPLAQKYNGPILLTPTKQLNQDTLDELKRLGVKHLFIAGGLGAVSQSVEDALKASGIATIERIFGDTRYETSLRIAEKVGLSGKVVLATGSDFPDALSISGIAAKKGMPILLTTKDSLPVGIADYFKTKAMTQTYIVGGTGVISPGVANSVPGPIRLAGQDRYETNQVIMQNFAADLDFENVYVTVGSGFADALTGAVLAAKNSSPLVLTGKTLPQETANYLQTELKLSSKVKGLGGKNVVPSTILTGLIAAKEQLIAAEKYSVAGTYGPETGSKKIQGDVIISVRDVILKNMIIEGDLLLGHSIGNGNVELRNVTVHGKTVINGGGPNSIIMYNFNGQNVIVDVPDGSSVRLVAQGSTSVGNVSMEGNGNLEESELTGTGFATVQIPAGAEVTLNGDFGEVNIEASGARVNVTGGNITTLTIAQTATGAGVNLAQTASVSTLNANAGANVTGQGQITTANVNVSNVTIEQKPTNVTVAQGVTSNIGGQQQSGTNPPPPAGGGGGGGPSTVAVETVTVTPKTLVLAVEETAELQVSITPANATNKNVTWSSSNESVAKVANGIVSGLAKGNADISVTTSDGQKIAVCKVTVAQAVSEQAELTAALADATIPAIKLIGSFNGFKIERPVIIAGGTITPVTILGEPAGIYLTTAASGTVIDGVTIKGTVNPRNVGIVTQSNTELTVRNSSLKDLTTGIYLNPGSKLTATGNTMDNLTAGIGTEKADLTGDISKNSYNDCVEAIGLFLPINSDGSPMIEAEAEDLAATLKISNNLDDNKVNLYGTFPTGTVKRYNEAGKYQNIYETITEAITAAVEGDTVKLGAKTYLTESKLSINKKLTIVGAAMDKTIIKVNVDLGTDNSKKHALSAYANHITIKNLTIDSDMKAYGVSTYNNATLNLENITLKNSKASGLLVGGSTVFANNLITIDNAWGAVNVDPGKGVTDPSHFELSSGTLNESTQIWSDGKYVTDTATVSVNAEGYTKYAIAGGTYIIWTNQPLTNGATVTKDDKTTMYSTIQAAINAALAGSVNEVNIASGTYDEIVKVTNQSVTLIGASKETTNIKAISAYPGIDNTLEIKNLTVYGNNTSGQAYAGIFIANGNVLIDNCNIAPANGADSTKRGIETQYNNSANITVKDCNLSGYKAPYFNPTTGTLSLLNNNFNGIGPSVDTHENTTITGNTNMKIGLFIGYGHLDDEYNVVLNSLSAEDKATAIALHQNNPNAEVKLSTNSATTPNTWGGFLTAVVGGELTITSKY